MNGPPQEKGPLVVTSDQPGLNCFSNHYPEKIPQPDQLLRPGSQVSLCGGCGLVFGNVRAFDIHRVGDYPQRRCLTNPQLSERGLEYDPRGLWRFPRRTYTGPRRVSA